MDIKPTLHKVNHKAIFSMDLFNSHHQIIMKLIFVTVDEHRFQRKGKHMKSVCKRMFG